MSIEITEFEEPGFYKYNQETAKDPNLTSVIYRTISSYFQTSTGHYSRFSRYASNMPTSAILIGRHPTSERPLSSNPFDLAKDVTQAISDAKSGNWAGAAADSLEVAKDVIDITTEIGNSFIESRTEAVQGEYSENSEVGFQ